MLDTMYRYFRPLADDISPILVDKTVKKWQNVGIKSQVAPKDISTRELNKAWESFVKGKNITSLNRSEEFFQWRYKKSPVYKYHFFGNQENGGFIVGRIGDLYDENHLKTDMKIFRILELIPSNQDAWEKQADDELSALIDGVCGWAQNQGCMAAEFYMSTSRFGNIMKKACFEEINKTEPLASSIMSYFEPMSESHRLSNVSLQCSEAPEFFDFEDSYFTLSDADQDRPNIL